MNQQLPQNVEAERAILGAILVNNEMFYDVAYALSSADFYVRGHQIIFRTITDLLDESKAADLVTLQERLTANRTLSDCGGLDYLLSLTDGIPFSTNVEHYVSILRDKSALRRIYKASMDSAKACLEAQDSADDILNAAEQRLFAIGEQRIKTDFVSAGDMERDVHTSFEKLYCDRNSVSGLATGFREFDRLTSGLQPSDLIILAARPSAGKTALALNLTRFATLELQRSVAFFSLEMTRIQLLLRLLCSDAMVDGQRVRAGFLNREEFRKLIYSLDRFKKARLFIDDASQTNVLQMRAKCRRLRAESGLDLVVIDYIGLVAAHMKTGSREQEVSSISRALKGLAKELNVPVVALSQLNRQTENRGDGRPQLSDLRESGSLEQDADVVSFIYREEMYRPSDDNRGLAELLIAKQRNGPIGSVKLAFRKNLTRFESFTNPQPERNAQTV